MKRIATATQLLFLLSLLCTTLRAQTNQWADSILNTLSLDQKIGQLIMIPAYSNRDASHVIANTELITRYHIGGIIFMQGTPDLQVSHLNTYQRAAQIPLLIAQDAEWGLAMRLDNAPKFPKNMTLGAIRNDSILYDMGREMGRQLQRTGVHVNFAPVIDVNNNANNPVINHRSFGQDKFNVTKKALMLMKGMQDNGVLACAKHFPGHGDTDTDSHFDLPVLNHSLLRLDTLELFPFDRVLHAGIGSVMVAHLHIPALDPTPNLPATLSRKIVHDIIRQKLHFEGLIFTDALNMHAITKHFAGGEAALRAPMAGNDILLFPEDIPASVNAIRTAVQQGQVPLTELNDHVRRILLAKQKVHATQKGQQIPPQNLLTDLNSQHMKVLRRRLYEAAITLAKNTDQLIPLRTLASHRIAHIRIGGHINNAFEQTLQKYAPVQQFSLPANASPQQIASLQEVLKRLNFTTAIVSVYDIVNSPSKQFGIFPSTVDFCNSLAPKTILVLFGNAYSLSHFGSEEAIVVAYEDDPDAEVAAASALFGGIRTEGKLPVSVSDQFPAGIGSTINKPLRFGFALPEEVGMDSRALARIDSVANYFIQRKAMPGCAVLVMRYNKIVFERGFGHTQYDNNQAVSPLNTYYDLASVTKILATTPTIMHLVAQGILDLYAPLSTYLPELIDQPIGQVSLRRLLQHNAGLPDWRGYYTNAFPDKTKPQHSPLFSHTRSETFSVEIAPGYYAQQSLRDSMKQWIFDIVPRQDDDVIYSDIGMMMLGIVIERVMGRTLNEVTEELFYRPMGMASMGYRPADRGLEYLCAPAQMDSRWRMSKIQGYVQDENAAALCGIAGHAGLFANVYDVAKFMSMLSNGGMYGGDSYLPEETVKLFTHYQPRSSRRALGFDKPETMRGRLSPAPASASASTFGHMGYTGTSVWADPDNELVYVFLSNRTYPDPNNRKMIEEGVRIKVMEKVYAAMASYFSTEFASTIKTY